MGSRCAQQRVAAQVGRWLQQCCRPRVLFFQCGNSSHSAFTSHLSDIRATWYNNAIWSAAQPDFPCILSQGISKDSGLIWDECNVCTLPHTGLTQLSHTTPGHSLGLNTLGLLTHHSSLLTLHTFYSHVTPHTSHFYWWQQLPPFSPPLYNTIHSCMLPTTDNRC
jgi:hypothetical protein